MRLIIPTALTLVYLCVVFWSLHGNQELGSLRLNELGDFIAGFLGPVALIWLITGIFLQGYEMRANTKQLEKSRRVSEEALKIKRQDLLIQSKNQKLDYIKYRQKIRSEYAENFVYLDHDDAGFLRTPYKSKYGNVSEIGDCYAEISRERIIFLVKNYGVSGRLTRVLVDDIYRNKPAFQVRFFPSFQSPATYNYDTPLEPILDINAGSRYKIVFEFDKTIEPRLDTKEQVDFDGITYLFFDVKESDGNIRKIIQEVEYKFMFDERDINIHLISGIADESILKFYPAGNGAIFGKIGWML